MSQTGASLTSSFELLHAIDRSQLFLEYQPLVDLATGQVDSLEALVRWAHPALGRVEPDQFLEVAENAALGGALTSFVLARALADCAAWQRIGLTASVAVNVSPAVLSGDLVPTTVAMLLDAHGLEPHQLTIEVTERRCPLDLASVRRTLVGLSRTGVQLSLDDFGVGDSSLSRLQQIQFDEIKIDRSFVAAIADDPTDRQIVRFTTELAHGLGMRIVAEGVEHVEVIAALSDLGVDLAQGYLLARPFPLADLDNVGSLAERRPSEDRLLTGT